MVAGVEAGKQTGMGRMRTEAVRSEVSGEGGRQGGRQEERGRDKEVNPGYENRRQEENY